MYDSYLVYDHFHNIYMTNYLLVLEVVLKVVQTLLLPKIKTNAGNVSLRIFHWIKELQNIVTTKKNRNEKNA